ncbi:MAG: hypothetical protein KDD45_09040, partial [Bdellovibrionales bacterium]|nr:hypothetical protein [Bdellovibrionales bacterium]
ILWDWQQQDPSNRSILPRSEDGHWQWFRLFMSNKQSVNFWKISNGSAPDQPSLYEWLSIPKKFQHFSAILGFPVNFSRTPVEQQAFFLNHHMPVLSINISENDFVPNFTFLLKLGLRAAAVTSPLKRVSYNFIKSNKIDLQELGSLENKFKSVNTLFIKSENHSQDFYLSGANTDLAGFKALTHNISKDSHIIVWGGGGTLPIIKEIFPNSIEYSVRTGLPRNGEINISDTDVLIWAASPSAEAPKLKSPPRIVVDLNYRADSAAIEYSKLIKAKYISGEEMFKIQAEHQRNFWNKYF